MGAQYVASPVGLDFTFVDLPGTARRSRGYRVGAGSPPERRRRVRFLCAVAVVVAVVLRGVFRAWHRSQIAGPMRRAAVLIRGARPLAAVRTWLPRLLPATGPAARSQHHDLNAG